MKQSILLMSAVILATHSGKIDAHDKATPVAAQETAPAQPTRNVIQVKPQSTVTLKAGEAINLSEYTKMPSGVMYKTIKKGSGEKPVNGETLTVHYSGHLLIDGKTVGMKFDSSLDRNQPFNFKLGARMVIPGWELSLADMKVGETRIVILPSKLAYGSRATASIPADSTLLFEITLIKAS